MDKKRLVILTISLIIVITAIYQIQKWHSFYKNNLNIAQEYQRIKAENNELKEVIVKRDITISKIQRELLEKTTMFAKELDSQVKEQEKFIKTLQAFKEYKQKEHKYWKGEAESTKELIEILEDLQ